MSNIFDGNFHWTPPIYQVLQKVRNREINGVRITSFEPGKFLLQDVASPENTGSVIPEYFKKNPQELERLSEITALLTRVSSGLTAHDRLVLQSEITAASQFIGRSDSFAPPPPHPPKPVTSPATPTTPPNPLPAPSTRAPSTPTALAPIEGTAIELKSPVMPVKVDLKDLNCPPEWGICFEKGNGQKFHFTLLPAMSSQIRNGAAFDVPNASPGLQITSVPAIQKSRMPGFAPLHQVMGIDSVMVKMVGAFTGTESSTEPAKPRRQALTPDPRGSRFFEYGGARRAGDITGLREAGGSFDSFNTFHEFFDFVGVNSDEFIVEINTNRAADGSTKKKLRGALRSEAGNPRFKGILRKMEIFHARHDRTWYTLEVEVTDTGLAVQECIDRNYTVPVPEVTLSTTVETPPTDYADSGGIPWGTILGGAIGLGVSPVTISGVLQAIKWWKNRSKGGGGNGPNDDEGDDNNQDPPDSGQEDLSILTDAELNARLDRNFEEWSKNIFRNRKRLRELEYEEKRLNAERDRRTARAFQALPQATLHFLEVRAREMWNAVLTNQPVDVQNQATARFVDGLNSMPQLNIQISEADMQAINQSLLTFATETEAVLLGIGKGVLNFGQLLFSPQ